MKRLNLILLFNLLIIGVPTFSQIYAPKIHVLDIPSNNVGINTQTPYYRLDTRFNDATTEFSGGTAGNWGANGIRLENTNTTDGALSPIHLRVGDADLHLTGIRRGTNLADLGLFFEGTQKFNFSPYGLAFGTPVPYYSFDFRFDNGTSTFEGGSAGNWGANGIRLENTNTTNGALSPIHLRVGDADVHIAGIRRGANLADLGIFFEGKEKIIFKNNGIIHASSYTAENPPWADFVFDESYNLLKLEDVEKFIKENKHLPEVPSEKEVSRNGVDLVDMNAKLLQKVEELTLYLIQQNKKINDLQEQITELKQ